MSWAATSPCSSEVGKGSTLPRQAAAVGGVASPHRARRRRIGCEAMPARARPSWSWTTTRSSATWCASCWRRSASTVLSAANGRECLALAERTQAEPHPARYRHAGDGRLGGRAASAPGFARPRRHRHAVGATPSTRSRLLSAEPLYDDYLMKPIDLRELLKKIHALLNHRMDLRGRARESVPRLRRTPARSRSRRATTSMN